MIKKLFTDKKGQFAKAMRRSMDHDERNYRKIKARYLYNKGKDINQIALEFGVSPTTIQIYLRETKHLTKEEAESKYRSAEFQAKFQLAFLKYGVYLIIIFMAVPFFGFLFDGMFFQTGTFWFLFFWKHWFLSLVIIPSAYVLIKLYMGGKLTSDLVHGTTECKSFNTKINGLRYRCSANYLNKLKQGDKLILERDSKNRYDKRAVKVINKDDNNHLGFIPVSFNESKKIFQKLEENNIIDCFIETIYKNPKDWLNSHTVKIKILYKE